MQTSAKEIELTIAAILKHAGELREAGVLKLTVDTVSVELAAHKPADPSFDMTEPEDEKKPRRGGIWNDAALFGRDEGSPVPGLKEQK